MFGKPFDQIAKEDIDRLITDGIREGRQVDYKQKPPGGGDGERKEFAADATSFANAAGGYIIFGVTEQKDAAGKNTGVPASADGLANVNGDQEVLRLESMLRANVDPIIPGCRFKIVDGFPSGPVILLHVPRSWTAPHMVAVTADSRFHTRGSAGKQSMDVREIRSAFVLSAEMPTLIRRFRDERLGRIVADETPVALGGRARLVVHVVPFEAMRPEANIDLAPWASKPPSPPTDSGWKSRYNFDGFVTFNGVSDRDPASAYLQVFRSGALEAVALSGTSRNGIMYFCPWSIEETVVDALAQYLPRCQTYGVEPPVAVLVSVLSMRGARVPQSARAISWDDRAQPVDRDVLILPDALIQDYAASVPGLLRPAFDALWQAVGVSKSLAYDAAGKWERGFRW